MIITLRFRVADVIIDWAIEELIASGTAPSRITKKAVKEIASEVYSTYGGQGEVGGPDEVGLDNVEPDGPTDAMLDTINAVRERLSL